MTSSFTKQAVRAVGMRHSWERGEAEWRWVLKVKEVKSWGERKLPLSLTLHFSTASCCSWSDDFNLWFTSKVSTIYFSGESKRSQSLKVQYLRIGHLLNSQYQQRPHHQSHCLLYSVLNNATWVTGTKIVDEELVPKLYIFNAMLFFSDANIEIHWIFNVWKYSTGHLKIERKDSQLDCGSWLWLRSWQYFWPKRPLRQDADAQ